MSQPLTYQQLIDTQARKVLLEDLNEHSVANRVSALNNFLKANHLDSSDVVGDEMRLHYPEAIERLIRHVERAGWSRRNMNNTRSLMRHWKSAVVEHDAIEAITAGQATPFMLALKSVIEGHAIKRVAREAGIPPDMLFGWLRGKVPRGSNERYLLRLEGYFGLERYSLVSISGIKRKGTRQTVGPTPSPIQYSSIVSELSKTPFCLKPAIDSPLRNQWYEFLHYKTSAAPSFKRTKRGKWRISPCPLIRNSPTNWASFYDGKEVASAQFAWYKISAYLGWLRLPTESGGVGMQENDVQTLAWLVVPEFIEGFLEWSKARIGKRNQSANQFLALIASLVRPRFGYLRQRPEYQSTLPNSYQDGDWEKFCDRQFEQTEQLLSSYSEEIEVSRDSFEPIRKIIQLPQPMDAIADMVQRMRADRPVGQPRQEIIWARDILLIKLLVSIPLRLRNLAHLTWKADNTGELYQRIDKSWWVRISKTRFKNARGAAGDNIFDCQVHPSAWRDIERYLFQFRSKLMQSPTDLVFLSRLFPGNTTHVPWRDLSKRVHALTTKYVVSSPGIHVHAFRHIVACSILKAEGGSYKVAALVLNDRVATVERHYSGLQSNDGTEQMAKLLEGPLSRMY